MLLSFSYKSLITVLQDIYSHVSVARYIKSYTKKKFQLQINSFFDLWYAILKKNIIIFVNIQVPTWNDKVILVIYYIKKQVLNVRVNVIL